MITASTVQKNKWDDSHRPWPLPSAPWTMRQIWCDLLLAHYPISYDALRKLVPPTLPLDAYEGMCWISVVPFRMSGIRVRGLPVIPGTSGFPELNVRTYVIIDGKPGVYFFSLEAANWLAVKSARTLYHLPYWYAHMSMEKTASTIAFQSTRQQRFIITTCYDNKEFSSIVRHPFYILRKKSKCVRGR